MWNIDESGIKQHWMFITKNGFRSFDIYFLIR